MIPRKKPPHRRPKTERQKLDAEALRLWSRVVRERAGGCCRVRGASTCRGRFGVAHHMVRRQFWGTRHLTENGLAACVPCHFWLHNHCPDEVALYRSLGVDWEALQMRKRVGGKGLDLKLVVLSLKGEVDGG